MKPLHIIINPEDLNAFEYILQVASSTIQTSSPLDRDSDRAEKLAPKLQVAVRRYRKATGIALTKQWEWHGTYHDKRKANIVLRDLKKQGWSTMVSLSPTGEVIDIYTLK